MLKRSPSPGVLWVSLAAQLCVLLLLLATLTATDGTSFTSSFSAGVAEMPRHGDDVNALFDVAIALAQDVPLHPEAASKAEQHAHANRDAGAGRGAQRDRLRR